MSHRNSNNNDFTISGAVSLSFLGDAAVPTASAAATTRHQVDLNLKHTSTHQEDNDDDDDNGAAAQGAAIMTTEIKNTILKYNHDNNSFLAERRREEAAIMGLTTPEEACLRLNPLLASLTDSKNERAPKRRKRIDNYDDDNQGADDQDQVDENDDDDDENIDENENNINNSKRLPGQCADADKYDDISNGTPADVFAPRHHHQVPTMFTTASGFPLMVSQTALRNAALRFCNNDQQQQQVLKKNINIDKDGKNDDDDDAAANTSNSNDQGEEGAARSKKDNNNFLIDFEPAAAAPELNFSGFVTARGRMIMTASSSSAALDDAALINKTDHAAATAAAAVDADDRGDL